MDFELTRLVQLSVHFLNKKKRPVSMDPKRPSYQRTVRWTMQGLTEPFFEHVFTVVILQRRKVVKCVQFTGKWGYFSKTERRLQQKAPFGP